MKTGVLLYSNSDGVGQRVVRDFLASLFSNIESEFSSKDAKKFLANYRVPNERELAGVFVKSCLNFEKECFIATELQVRRKKIDNGNQFEISGLGRVDFLVIYRNISFLIELKVARVPVKTLRQVNSGKLGKDIVPWANVCKQLESLDVNDLVFNSKKTIKIPILMYFYVSQDDCDDKEKIESTVMQKHNYLISKIDNAEASRFPVTFEYISGFTKLLKSHRRKSPAIINGEQVNIWGFSVIAGEVVD